MHRLKRSEIEGFRAFARQEIFDVDADVVILAGPNGSGKTSFFDSVLWGLSGRLPRFSERDAQAINLYSDSGTARVALEFAMADGGPLRIVRTAASEDTSNVFLESPDSQLEGDAAQRKIFELFWPSALQSQDGLGAFCMAFTRSVYLQQDLVREFIESDTETSRFTVMSELVGAGRINDFRRELERERNAWSRARTRREDELQAALARLEQVRARLERLREAGSPAGILSEWAAWWEQARTRGVTDAAPEATSVKAPSVLGDALGSLQTLRRRLERRREEVADLLREWSQRSAKETETLPTIVETSQRRRDELAAEHAALQSALLQTQTEAAHERERLIQTQETEAEMRSLAALAIRHLGETCPVCAQKHDVDRTRRRLEDLLHSQPTHDPTPIFERVAALNQQIVDTEKALAAATAEVATRERATADERIWARTLVQRLTDLGLPADSSLAAVERSLRGIEEQLNALAVMHVRGEELALALTTAAESAQRTELSEQLVVAQRLVDERRSDLTQHERTGETATSILEATRTAARLAVDERVQQIEPLVERIYARMDPHPVFTKVRLATSYTGGRGHIRPLVEDPSAGLTDRDPYTLFSSSQLNALAVSLFLGLNLGTHGASLRTVMLDDPLQSLDDVNLLGLIDTLRRTKAHRQLLISTHDPRLTQLVRRKLRPVGNDQRTRVYSFSDWDETGPKVAEEEVQAEPAEFRMAAA